MKRSLVEIKYAIALFLVCTAMQSIAENSKPDVALEGRWEGALIAGQSKLRVVLEILRSGDAGMSATLISVDQGGQRFSADSVEASGESIRLSVKAINGRFSGSLNADHTKINGVWDQGVPAPLEFTRTNTVRAFDHGAPSPSERQANGFTTQLDIELPAAPTPFQGGNQIHLAYELRLTNFGRNEVELSRLEVLSDTGTLATIEGGELDALIQKVGIGSTSDKRIIGAGQRVIVYMWVNLPGSASAPKSLHHRLTMKDGSSLDAATVTVPNKKPISIGPPLRGSTWVAFNGPGNDANHRRAVVALNGKAHIGQRFAIDWVRIDADGKAYDGDEKQNKNYLGYGSEVLAVANGIVSTTKDGIPENIPGPTSRAVPITPETVGGNNIIVRIDDDHYAFYAHLQPGSLRVKMGDKVRRGQVIGLLGNSGNSTGPHLHFQICDRNSGLESEGVPYSVDSFEVKRGPSAAWELRKNQLPMNGAHVKFVDAK